MFAFVFMGVLVSGVVLPQPGTEIHPHVHHHLSLVNVLKCDCEYIKEWHVKVRHKGVGANSNCSTCFLHLKSQLCGCN